MRHSATKSLLERRDVIVVASVSCIYGIGEPDTYQGSTSSWGRAKRIDRDEIIRRLIAVQYERNDYDFHAAPSAWRGDVVEVFPANEESIGLRIELFVTSSTRSRASTPSGAPCWSASIGSTSTGHHYVTEASQLARAFETIQEELGERLGFLRQKNACWRRSGSSSGPSSTSRCSASSATCHGIENYLPALDRSRPGRRRRP